MSKFLSPLKVELVDPFANDGIGQWELTEPFQYYSSELKRAVEVPMGFSTDFASVPKDILAWGLLGGRYPRPAVVHDYITRQRRIARDRCDRIFLEAMRLQNAEEIEALTKSGEDNDEIVERKVFLEGRAKAMYEGVVIYTKSGAWKTDVDQPGFEPVG